MYSDKPIQASGQDELGYYDFAGRIVKPLLNWVGDESLVVGLYGSWGSGKSSVMNLLHQHLTSLPVSHSPQVIPIRFNPWLYGDTESLLLAFFSTLAAETKTAKGLSKEDSKALQDAFAELGESLGAILELAESWGGFVKLAGLTAKKLVAFGEKNITQRKEKAEKALKRIGGNPPGQRVVVLIDDLDRLDRSEIRTTLKLVKLLADLPYVSYVLAMDQARVVRVLDSEGEGESGLAYLEKIVQLPVYLPDPPTSKLKELVVHSLVEVLGLDPFLRQSGGRPWNISYEVSLGRRIVTLRDRARLINNLRFLILGGKTRLEVHPTDATLLSLLQTFYPDTYQRVRRNCNLLTGELDFTAMVGRYGMRPDERARAQLEHLHQIVTGKRGLDEDAKFDAFVRLPENDNKDFETPRTVIRALFPRAFNDEQGNDEQRILDRRENRIASPDRFERYFTLQPPFDEVSDLAIDRVVEVLMDIGGERVEPGDVVLRLFKPFMENGKVRRGVVRKIADRLPSSGTELCIGTTKAALLLDASLEPEDVMTLCVESATALETLAMRQESLEARESLMGLGREWIEGVSDPLQAVLIADALTARRRVVVLDEEEHRELAGLGTARMSDFVARGGDVFEGRDLFEASHILWRWKYLLERAGHGVEEIREYTDALLGASLHSLPRILSLVAGWGNGPSLIGTLSKQEIRKSLEVFGGVEHLLPMAKAYLARPDAQDEHNLVHQFVELFADEAKEPSA